MIKAIAFDLDDTLYRQEVPFVAAIKLVFPQLIEEELTPLFIQSSGGMLQLKSNRGINKLI